MDLFVGVQLAVVGVRECSTGAFVQRKTCKMCQRWIEGCICWIETKEGGEGEVDLQRQCKVDRQGVAVLWTGVGFTENDVLGYSEVLLSMGRCLYSHLGLVEL